MKSKRQSSPSQQTKEESGVYTLSLHNSPCKFRAAYIFECDKKKRPYRFLGVVFFCKIFEFNLVHQVSE